MPFSGDQTRCKSVILRLKYIMMKQIFTTLFLLLTFGAFAQVRISQAYVAGGNTGATFNQDFVELFNAGNTAVAIGGWSVQYASATGTAWAASPIPAGASIAPGQYFLMAMATTGATGAALPTPDATGTSSMSATAGKIALVNTTTALSGSTACSNATVVDVLGYGSTATCAENTVFSTTGIVSTQSIQRVSNGCTDANNNSTDFILAAVAPRNTASPANPCGAPSAVIAAVPSALSATTSVGVASASVTYNLSGSTLTPASGSVTVTPAAGVEVSTDNTSFSATPINVAYSGGTLAATPIYVRIAATAPQGAVSATISNSGGGATTVNVTLNGGVFQNYYSKSAGGLDNTATWGTNTDGSGSAPANFTSAYQNFNVVNQSNASIAANWDVSGTSSRIIVGDGVSPITLTVPTSAFITTTSRVDLAAQATLVLLNNTRPFLGSLAANSTVDFAQTGATSADTIRIPAISYFNLKFTGGLKYFSSGTTTFRGDFTADGVVSMNGAGSPFSTINAFGNLTFLNSSQFEPVATGDAARLTLAMNGSSGTQAINANGTDLRLFRLRRDSTGSSVNINVSTGTTLTLGNTAGGGLQLNQGAATTTTLGIQTGVAIRLIRGAIATTGSNGRINANGGSIYVEKSSGTANAGTLRFRQPALLDSLVVNLDPAVTRDSVTIADSVAIDDYLALTKGKVVVPGTSVLTLNNSAVLAGGSATAFIDGSLRRDGIPATAYTLPVGKGNKYAPVQLQNFSGANNYTVLYNNAGYGSYAIDPVTLGSFPGYNVSAYEYWTIGQGTPGQVDITFNYTDAGSLINNPAAIRMAHYDGADWNDLGGTPNPSNTTTNGSVTVTGVSTFSPFTFAATTGGVIPVRLSSFNVQKRAESVKISWTTSQEINSARFEVERAADGRNWTRLATVTAAGNSAASLSYSIIDPMPIKGINYYRLKMIDLDGRTTYSPVQSVLFSNNDQVLIAPNPTSDFINIYLATTAATPVSISLTDVNGKLLKTVNTLDQQVKWTTTGLAKGIYFVRIVRAGETTVQKVRVQ
jgi:trimeric autotransporter adhesin